MPDQPQATSWVPGTILQEPAVGTIHRIDCEEDITDSLDLADSAYQLPGTGVPSSSMATAVQTSLGKADSAVQPAAIAGFYTKPGGGIPSTDLTTDLQNAVALAGQAIVAIGGLSLVSNTLTATSSAATVKGSAAGAFKKTVVFTLKTPSGATATWYTGPITITPAKTCNDTDIGLPVVTGGNTVMVTAGVASVELTYDTDANVTKTYIATDVVSMTAAIANILGQVVTVTSAHFIDTLAA